MTPSCGFACESAFDSSITGTGSGADAAPTIPAPTAPHATAQAADRTGEVFTRGGFSRSATSAKDPTGSAWAGEGVQQ